MGVHDDFFEPGGHSVGENVMPYITLDRELGNRRLFYVFPRTETWFSFPFYYPPAHPLLSLMATSYRIQGLGPAFLFMTVQLIETHHEFIVLFAKRYFYFLPLFASILTRRSS